MTAVVLMALLHSPASAQEAPDVPTLNAQRWRPTQDSKSTLWTDEAGHIVDDPTWGARGWLSYTYNPIVFEYDNSDERTKLVSDAFQLDATGFYHIDRFRIGLHIPVYLFQAGELTQNGAGLGDVALDGRVTILDRDKDPLGLALGGRLMLPTGTIESPLKYGGVAGEITAIADYQVNDELMLAANLGTKLVPQSELLNVNLNDQFVFRVGGGYTITENAGASMDITGDINLADISNVASNPLEIVPGGWGYLTEELVLRGGIGFGLTRGIGAPPFRTLLSLSYEPAAEKDADGDGIMDDDDACPMEPEDRDEFQDEDGCPEADNDEDGILDADDECPLEPEDKDGFKDGDGCPDFSSQVRVRVLTGEGTPVPSPKVAVKGIETEESGDTADFMLDLHPGAYSLRGNAEDFVEKEIQFTVTDEPLEVVLTLYPDVVMGTLGIQVLNPDGKPLEAVWIIDGNPGVPLTDGKASIEIPAGDHNLEARAEGYITQRLPVTVPEGELHEEVVILVPSKVKVTKEKIDVKGTVYFETGRADIKPESFGLLDDVASILLDHPEILKIRIEGHTDSRGSADSNKRLSDKRAASVLEYMVKKGVERGRLRSVGYGEEKPIDPAETPEAWEKNRRVDFFIEERATE